MQKFKLSMMPLKKISRQLHSAVPRESVKQAIRSCIQASETTSVEYIKLGSDAALDTKIILAASQAANTPVPDHILASLSTCSDLLRYLCEPRRPPTVKGIPKFELFSGEKLPANVTLINYRKKKWSDGEYQDFLRGSFSNVGLLKFKRSIQASRHANQYK
jgi:hypothetical protein